MRISPRLRAIAAALALSIAGAFAATCEVGGVVVAHLVETEHPTLRKIVAVVDRVELDVEIPDSTFTVEKK